MARSQDLLEQLAAELRDRHGVTARVLAADLADPASPAAIHNHVTSAGITIDILINNAGFGVHGAFAESNLDEELALIQVNITALTHLTKLFVPGMIRRRCGRIMQVASTASFVPGAYMSCYYASKAYVLSHTLAVAEEIRGTGVTITALCPGPTRTGFQKRAGMRQASLLGSAIMDSMSVARAGYRGMLRGKSVVIPGLTTRLMVFATRFAPRRILARTTARLNRDRKS